MEPEKATDSRAKRAEAERARQPTLATRVERAVRMMDIDVYGPILMVLDDAEQGNFGPRAQARASDLFERTTTLSMLRQPYRSIGLSGDELRYEETGAMEPLAAAFRGVARDSLASGLDGDQRALTYSLLAQSGGLESPVATRDELVRVLTGVSPEEFERAIAQVRLMLQVASGEAEGASVNNPRRYVKREIKRLVDNDSPVFPTGYRDWSAEGAEELAEKAQSLLSAVDQGIRAFEQNVQEFRSRAIDEEVSELLARAGILPRDTTELAAFSGISA